MQTQLHQATQSEDSLQTILSKDRTLLIAGTLLMELQSASLSMGQP